MCLFCILRVRLSNCTKADSVRSALTGQRCVFFCIFSSLLIFVAQHSTAPLSLTNSINNQLLGHLRALHCMGNSRLHMIFFCFVNAPSVPLILYMPSLLLVAHRQLFVGTHVCPRSLFAVPLSVIFLRAAKSSLLPPNLTTHHALPGRIWCTAYWPRVTRGIEACTIRFGGCTTPWATRDAERLRLSKSGVGCVSCASTSFAGVSLCVDRLVVCSAFLSRDSGPPCCC